LWAAAASIIIIIIIIIIIFLMMMNIIIFIMMNIINIIIIIIPPPLLRGFLFSTMLTTPTVIFRSLPLCSGLLQVLIDAVPTPSTATIAKRRSYASTVSYLTPPAENAGLYKVGDTVIMMMRTRMGDGGDDDCAVKE
jgi:hypothetical protein